MYLCSAGTTRRASTPSAPPTRRSTSSGPATDQLSDRDAEAPTLDEVKAAGLLPTWDDAKAFVEELRRRDS